MIEIPISGSDSFKKRRLALLHFQLQVNQESEYELMKLLIHKLFIELARIFDDILNVAVVRDN